MTDPILHHFWASPFAHKIRLAMGLAGVSWSSVEIPRVPPKPFLMPLTGGYRRTPVLQIGADVYCDTQLIASVIAKLGDAERLFPNDCEARALMFSEWVDQTLFPLAVRVVITTALDTAPSDFVKDRGDLYFGSGWSEAKLRAELAGVILHLQASLKRLDASIHPDQYALGGVTPSYADVAIAYLCWFLRGRWADGPECLARYPNLCRIESEIGSATEGNSQGQVAELDALDALQVAKDSESQSPIGIELEQTLEFGQVVSVRPFVDSSDPVVLGRLRYLDEARVSIDVDHAEVGSVAVHFPTVGYLIAAQRPV